MQAAWNKGSEKIIFCVLAADTVKVGKYHVAIQEWICTMHMAEIRLKVSAGSQSRNHLAVGGPRGFGSLFMVDVGPVHIDSPVDKRELCGKLYNDKPLSVSFDFTGRTPTGNGRFTS